MDLNKYKVTQLKAVLQEQQLPTTGSKTELIARIQAADLERILTRRLEEDVDEMTAQESPPAPGSSGTLTRHDSVPECRKRVRISTQRTSINGKRDATVRERESIAEGDTAGQCRYRTRNPVEGQHKGDK